MSHMPLENPIAQRLMAMAARRSGAENVTAEPSTPLNQLGIDSLGLAELMFDIDDEFGVEITDEQMMQVKIVSDLVAVIEGQLSAKAQAA